MLEPIKYGETFVDFVLRLLDSYGASPARPGGPGKRPPASVKVWDGEDYRPLTAAEVADWSEPHVAGRFVVAGPNW